jgi:hypothetical protein
MYLKDERIKVKDYPSTAVMILTCLTAAGKGVEGVQ